MWLMISVYQGLSLSFSIINGLVRLTLMCLCKGGAIMIMSLVLFENEFLNIVSISFTALVLNELIMVAVEITTWFVSHVH